MDNELGNFDAVLNGVFALTERRLWLCKNVPVCPACGEKMQIQLVDWSVTPADWKCRTCKYKWQFEPEKIDGSKSY
jgi:tRNA(Ile2) C34 agmatinyltransferase TiaS